MTTHWSRLTAYLTVTELEECYHQQQLQQAVVLSPDVIPFCILFVSFITSFPSSTIPSRLPMQDSHKLIAMPSGDLPEQGVVQSKSQDGRPGSAPAEF